MIGADVAEQPLAFVYTKSIVSEVVTSMFCVVSPVDHAFPVPCEELNVTVSPSQMVVGPFGVIVGAFGSGFTVTVTEADVEEHPVPSV